MADPIKNAFMLSSATIMITPFGGTPVFDLQPLTHSVGMAQEVSINVESGSIDLMNGVAQALVDSRKTNVSAMISANVREFTAQNFMYSQGLSGTATQIKRGTLSSAAAAASASLSIVSAPLPGETASAITAIGDIPTGSTIIIQDANNPDRTFVTKTSGVATGAGPYSVPIAGAYVTPAAVAFAIGDYVWIVSEVGVADVSQDNLVSVKIAGTLANFNRPVVAVFPKVRIVKGFQLSFSETEYGAMPWELKPLLLTASEATGRLAEVGTKRPGLVYAG